MSTYFRISIPKKKSTEKLEIQNNSRIIFNKSDGISILFFLLLKYYT